MAHPVPYLVLPKNMYKAVIFDFDGVLFDSVESRPKRSEI